MACASRPLDAYTPADGDTPAVCVDRRLTVTAAEAVSVRPPFTESAAHRRGAFQPSGYTHTHTPRHLTVSVSVLRGHLTVSGGVVRGHLTVSGDVLRRHLTVSGGVLRGHLTVSGSVLRGHLTVPGSVMRGHLTVSGGVLRGHLTVCGGVLRGHLTVSGGVLRGQSAVHRDRAERKLGRSWESAQTGHAAVSARKRTDRTSSTFSLLHLAKEVWYANSWFPISDTTACPDAGTAPSVAGRLCRSRHWTERLASPAGRVWGSAQSPIRSPFSRQSVRCRPAGRPPPLPRPLGHHQTASSVRTARRPPRCIMHVSIHIS